MVFVELTPFVVFREAHWHDEDLRALQNFLLSAPHAGAVIPGSSGLRKLRWGTRGRGKRSGARVIYYWYVPADTLYLIHAYAKNETADLTRDQIRTLAGLMRNLNG